MATAIAFSSFILPVAASADEAKPIEKESIYDLLVDRFFNGSGQNDQDVNAKDPTAFNGGDFKGLIDKKSFIETMGFSIVSVGTVFDTEKYDGSMPTSYEKIEEHFGTEVELKQVISSYGKSGMKIMIDFPLSNVSPNHEWANNSSWIASKENGKVQFDLNNQDVQNALKEALKKFVEKYEVSIRLTNIEGAPTSFLNELIDVVKAANTNEYVISNTASDANFDAKYDPSMIETQRDIFKNVDLDSSKLLQHKDSEVPTLVMIDSPWTDRFTLYSAMENMYPPKRVEMAVLSALLLPGVPVVQYGTEIVMNGKAGSEAHQLYNFKTDTDLIDQIKNVQSLLKKSDTLHNGDFELLENDNGYIAFLRTTEEEQWLVVINNTSQTKSISIPESKIGEGKKLTAILDTETVRANKNDEYTVILDREIVELFHIQDDKGINKSYLVALALVYILFTWFVIVIIKRGKKNRTEQ